MRYLGAIILISIALSGCAAKRPVEIVIPQGCITSDVICHQSKDGPLRCRFDKFVGCEQVRIVK